MKYKVTRKLALIATVLAFVVVILGAYTRLQDAGLGCPDWPGCYEKMIVPSDHESVAEANALYPERPVEKKKAWAEMVHRYFAGALGLLIAAIALIAWKERKKKRHPVVMATALLVLVIFQAALGMWTVTMKLMPAIVMAHLLGGFSTLTMLFCLSIRLSKANYPFRIHKNKVKELAPYTILGLVILSIQIALGGWTSSNYAAVVCSSVASLPICQGDWMSLLNFREAFQLWGFGVDNYEFGHLDAASRITIHVVHRIGALVTFFYLAWLAWRLQKAQNNILADMGKLMAILLVIQFSLGISNVVFSLPLLVAVAHNGFAALLLLCVAGINFILWAHKRRG